MNLDSRALEAGNAVAEPVKILVFSVIKYVWNCKHNLDTLKDRVEVLKVQREEVEMDIEDAVRKDQSATRGVRKWLSDVEKLQDEQRKMDAEFESMYTCIGICSPNVASMYRLSTKAEELIQKASDLREKFPPISRTSDPDEFVRRPCVKLFVGRGSVLEDLQRLALDPNNSIIGMHGMAGVGKTELLNHFYMKFHSESKEKERNDRNDRDGGHHMIWVDMKNCRTVKDTQKAITERLQILWHDNDKQEVRAKRIARNLEKKNFVLILDGMWSAVNLKDVGIPIATEEEDVGIPTATQGDVGIPNPTQQKKSCKIILATRREDICDTMEAKKIQIKCLDWEDAWNLFVEKAGKDLTEPALLPPEIPPEIRHQAEILHPEIRHQAEELVKKCGGLPLALVTIGRAMARKRTPDLWKHAVTALESTPHKIQGMKEVLSCLKRSYDELKDEKLRTCLSYCTMFPENHDIYMNNIVDYCIGEGVLVDRFYDGEHVYNEGYYLLDVLKSASMLEPSSTPNDIKMHPMIRILSLSIESGAKGTKCLIRAGKGLAEAPDVHDWERVKKISLMYNNIETLSEKPNSPSLLTLLLNGNPLLKICDGFFQSMTSLRVLDLSHSHIQKVPPEIGDLVQLQYLDFCDTKITELPVSLGQLVRLRYFLLSDTPDLKSIPDGLIKNLSKLHVLYMECSYPNWKVGSVGEGVDFEELESLKRLKTVGISVNTVSALRKLAGSNRLANCTTQLEIKCCPGLKSTLSTATVGRNFKALKNLYISGCRDLKELSIDASEEGPSSLPSLEHLGLIELPRAILTWNGGRFQNLRYLTIRECGKMRQLIHRDEGFMEEEDERSTEVDVLPNLYHLRLFLLPELESLSCGSRKLAFHSLEVLSVAGCPKLKKLPLHAEKLHQISGDYKWWSELDWTEDHHNIKSKLKFKNYMSEHERELLLKQFGFGSLVEGPASAGLGEDNPLYEKLQQLAIDDGVHIIGVYGMGGVGKTRLLDDFFHQFHLRDDYKMVRIDMDDSPNVEDTQMAVAREFGITEHYSKIQEERARIISEFLNQEKFILILDNVWEVVNLNAVGIPTTTRQAKHKIILATRIEDICDSMEARKLYVKCLEGDEARSLFAEKAGKMHIRSNRWILMYVDRLVENCGGLPHALITIGRAMAKKTTPEMWEDAVVALKNNPQQIPGMQDVFSRLKLSFDVDHLAYNLRTCLFYCFLIGKHENWDKDIRKQSIIDYCVGEGILDSTDLHNEGDKLLGVLKAKSLLEDGSEPDFVRVHPMIRMSALSDARNRLLKRAEKELTEIPDAVEWGGAERISLFGNNIKALSGKPDSPVLLTLLLQNNPIEKICNGFFQYMKNLRVLDLSYTHIQEVPAEIGELIQLQYLNLSNTQFRSLPKELGNLIRLRYLGLSRPRLGFPMEIPGGLIARLTDLRALSMVQSCTHYFYPYRFRDEEGDGFSFEELHRLKLLKALWISVHTANTLQKLAASPLLANCTLRLEVTDSKGVTTFSTATIGSEFKALQSLLLENCSDLEELAIDNGSCAGSSTLPHLKTIELCWLPRGKITWNGGRLESLVSLKISRCRGIRQLIHCDDESINEREVEKDILPNLQQLTLNDLPELESLSCGSKPLALPSLQVLDVADCPKLKKLPTNAERLQRIKGQKSWWNGLEWPEDDNIKSKYESVFVEKYF